jgi:O-antigen/teichoic acid export membrane protein
VADTGPPVAGPAPIAPDLLDTSDAGPAALRGGALRSAGYVAGLLMSLASAPLLIRHLGQEDFGRYVAVLSVVTVVAGFTEAGLNTIALREYATLTPDARDRTMADALGLRIALSAAGIVFGVALSALAGYGSTLVLGTLLAGVGMLLQSTQTMLSVGLQGSLRFGLATVTDLVRQAVTVILLVTLVVAGGTVVSFLAVPIAAGVVGVGLTAAFVRGVMPLRPRFDTQTWWPLVRDTIPYAVAIALNAAYFRVAIVVMSITATELQTGYFSTSFRVVEVLIGVPALVVGAAFPILSRAVRDDRARFAQATERLFELGILAGTLMAVGIGLGAGFATDVLGGADAEPAAEVLRIQGVAMVATFVAVACGYPLLSLRRNKEIMLANGAALLASVVLTLVLVPSLQARGAAIAAVSAETALAVVTTVMLKRAEPALRLPLGVIPVALAAAAAGVGAGLLLGGPEVVRAVVGSVVFLVVVVLLGRFPPEVRHALAARRREAHAR